MPRYQHWDFRNPHSKDLHIENLHPIVIDVLIARGINTKSKITKFIYPDIQSVNDPASLPDIESASKRFYEAISNHEKIMIYGDYDADGITASAIVTLFLKQLNVPVECYINDRVSEGYGISSKGIEYAISNDFKLIITVDNGITANQEIKRAMESGIDVIVTDHHEPGKELPGASAVIDPKRKDSVYPFPEIAGCLVAYKFCDYTRNRYKLSVNMEQLLELVAIGSIADVMPVLNENRVFIKRGLELIRENPLPGLNALIDISKINMAKMDTYAVGFILAPRLNAMGRLYNAKSAYRLLVSENYDEAAKIAQTLEKANRERQKLDRGILKEAIIMAEEKVNNNYNVIILSSNTWHEGVIGIVASKITEKFNKPTILFASEDMYSKGSGRSVDGFNLYNALSSCSKFIDAFGGHSMAAGLRIKNENIENLENCLNKIASNIKDIPDVKSLTVDMAIPLGIINDTLYQSISYLAPFGPGNPKPIFASFNVPIKYEPRIVGNGHVKFKFSTSAGNTIDGIFFNGKEYLSEINGNNVDICYTLQENNYMGRHSVELNIADIRNASTKE